MKRAVLIIGLFLVILGFAFIPLKQIVAPTPNLPSPTNVGFAKANPTPEPPGETRGLWVVRHTMTSPEAIRDLVRRAKTNGFTDLIVQVRGRGDAYYNSQLEPRAEDLVNQPGDFDPLALVIEEGHKVGVKVHAWINIYLVANIDVLPQARDHVIYKHPEWIMAPRGVAGDLYRLDPKSPEYLNRIVSYTKNNRQELEGLFVTPAHSEVQDNIFNIWMDIATKYAVDGLHFDYVRYPNPQFDFSRPSLDRFKEDIDKKLTPSEREALDKAFARDVLVYATRFPEQYSQFQRRQVTGLVERIYKGIKAAKPNIQISAAVFANDEDAARTRYQDWKVWLTQGWLDVVCPMAYTPETESFRKQIANAINHSAGRKVWGGIGAYKQTADGAIEKIQVGRQLGVNGFILFSYDSSIQVSSLNPRGDYLERVRGVLLKDDTIQAQ
jgi:uncharacterized lipoprotein YddW (UPF0748 family)